MPGCWSWEQARDYIDQATGGELKSWGEELPTNISLVTMGLSGICEDCRILPRSNDGAADRCLRIQVQGVRRLINLKAFSWIRHSKSPLTRPRVY
jgi:hypothetical protein